MQGLIFTREIRRSARRARTYLLRFMVVFPLFLLTFLCLLVLSSQKVSQTSGVYGIAMFWTLTVGLFILTLLLTPMLALQGILEEREQGTLELLELSGLGPWSILWTKVASRIWLVGTSLSGVLPFGMLILSWGGVHPMQILKLFSGLLLLGVVSAMIAAVCSFSDRIVALPFLASVIYALLFFGLVPGLVTLNMAMKLQHFPLQLFLEGTSPFFTLKGAQWEGLFIPWLLFIPVMLRVFIAGGTMLSRRIQYTGTANGSVWPGLPFSWMPHVVLLVVLWRLIASIPHDTVPVTGGGQQMYWACVALIAAVTYSGSMLYIRGTIWLMGRLNSNRSLLRWFRDGIYFFARPQASENQKPFRLTGVWSNPVAWREIMTGGAGAVGRTSLVMWALWIAVLGMVVYYRGLIALTRPELWYLMTVFSSFLCMICSALTVSASVSQERKKKTLELVVISEMSPLRILLGKLFAVLVQTCPMWMISLGLWWALELYIVQVEQAYMGQNYFLVHGLGLVFMGGWLFFVQLSVMLWSLVTTLWFRKSLAFAWVLNMAYAGLLYLVLTLLGGIFPAFEQVLPGTRAFASFFWPFYDIEDVTDSVTYPILLSVSVWVLFCTLLFLAAHWRLRRCNPR